MKHKGKKSFVKNKKRALVSNAISSSTLILQVVIAVSVNGVGERVAEK